MSSSFFLHRVLTVSFSHSCEGILDERKGRGHSSDSLYTGGVSYLCVVKIIEVLFNLAAYVFGGDHIGVRLGYDFCHKVSYLVEIVFVSCVL